MEVNKEPDISDMKNSEKLSVNEGSSHSIPAVENGQVLEYPDERVVKKKTTKRSFTALPRLVTSR